MCLFAPSISDQLLSLSRCLMIGTCFLMNLQRQVFFFKSKEVCFAVKKRLRRYFYFNEYNKE